MRAIALAVSTALHAAAFVAFGPLLLERPPATTDSAAGAVLYVHLTAAPGRVLRESPASMPPLARVPVAPISKPHVVSAPQSGAMVAAVPPADTSVAATESPTAVVLAAPSEPAAGEMPSLLAISLSSMPAYRYTPEPEYPRSAREEEREGLVVLHVLISREGLPVQILIEKTSGVPSLDAAAAAGVKRWTFTPARQGQQVIEAWMDVPVRFRLR